MIEVSRGNVTVLLGILNYPTFTIYLEILYFFSAYTERERRLLQRPSIDMTLVAIGIIVKYLNLKNKRWYKLLSAANNRCQGKKLWGQQDQEYSEIITKYKLQISTGVNSKSL